MDCHFLSYYINAVRCQRSHMVFGELIVLLGERVRNLVYALLWGRVAVLGIISRS